MGYLTEVTYFDKPTDLLKYGINYCCIKFYNSAFWGISTVNIIKNYSAVTLYDYMLQCLSFEIFCGKSINLPYPYTALHWGRLYPCKPNLKKLGTDKHSSLLCLGVSDEEKSFLLTKDMITSRYSTPALSCNY